MPESHTHQITSPTVRVQQSSPSPQQQSQSQSQSMIAQQSPFMGGGWNNYQEGYLSALPRQFKDQRIHKRGSSGSSVTSAGGPPSPLSQNTLHPRIATDSNFSPSYNLYEDYQTPHSAKSLSVPYDMSGMFNQANGYGPVGMSRIQSTGADDRASYTMSAPQSVSTMSHNSPATPHTNYENEYEDPKNYGK